MCSSVVERFPNKRRKKFFLLLNETDEKQGDERREKCWFKRFSIIKANVLAWKRIKRLEERPANICTAPQWISTLKHDRAPFSLFRHFKNTFSLSKSLCMQDGAVGVNGVLVPSHAKAFNSATVIVWRISKTKRAVGRQRTMERRMRWINPIQQPRHDNRLSNCVMATTSNKGNVICLSAKVSESRQMSCLAVAALFLVFLFCFPVFPLILFYWGACDAHSTLYCF